jgi:hypothetical protein
VAQAATDILGVDTEVESDTGEVEDVEAMDIDPEGEEELAVADLDVGGEDVGEDEVEMELQEDADEELEEEAPYGGGAGQIPDKDRRKRGHHGRGPKRKETAKEEGEINRESKAHKNNDRIAEEITRRVVERLLDPKA